MRTKSPFSTVKGKIPVDEVNCWEGKNRSMTWEKNCDPLRQLLLQ